jgi:hypothetical protein
MRAGDVITRKAEEVIPKEGKINKRNRTVK